MDKKSLEKINFYDPEMTIYLSYLELIEKESENPKSELLDLAELCVTKQKEKFKQMYYGLEDLTNKKLSQDESEIIYNRTLKFYHELKGMSLLTLEVLDKIKDYDEYLCCGRFHEIKKQYAIINETEENILLNYKEILE